MSKPIAVGEKVIWYRQRPTPARVEVTVKKLSNTRCQVQFPDGSLKFVLQESVERPRPEPVGSAHECRFAAAGFRY